MEEKIKKIITDLGASVCGSSSVERFKEVPEGFSPTDIYSECKSVIAFGVNLPKGLTKLKSSLIYGHFNYFSCSIVDKIAFDGAKIIEEKFNCFSLPMPCDNPYEYWDEDKLEGKGLISMKHTAILCGIGALGKNTLLLNPKYGNELTIGAILTDLELKSDDLCENICIKECHKCIENCPVGAIQEGKVVQKLCRNNAYGKTKRGFDTVECNKCRKVCPMRYGKNL